MLAIAAYTIAAGLGILLVLLLTHAPDLRHLRRWQIVPVPGVFLTMCWIMRDTGGKPAMGADIMLLVLIAITAFILAPNIAHLCGASVSNFLDRQNWTPAEEELALSPIRKLINSDRYYQALGDLEALQARQRRVLRVHLPSPAAVQQLVDALK